jgi:hypothetical protein
MRLCQFPTLRLRQGPSLETRQTQKVIGIPQLLVDAKYRSPAALLEEKNCERFP